jgi:hypothetical protein
MLSQGRQACLRAHDGAYLAESRYSFRYTDRERARPECVRPVFLTSPGGETGRRKGLKILCPVRDVRVRPPPRALHALTTSPVRREPHDRKSGRPSCDRHNFTPKGGPYIPIYDEVPEPARLTAGGLIALAILWRAANRPR